MAILPKNAGAIRLGPGEFTHYENRYETQREARRLFLEAIREEAPKVLGKLAKDPLTLFRALFERAVDAPTETDRQASVRRLLWTEELTWSHFKYADPARDREAALFRDVLTRWAQDCNLDSSADDWIMNRACDTLRSWCSSPDPLERKGLTWADDPRSITFELSRVEQTIALPTYLWNPQLEPVTEAKNRIRKDFERRLAAELKRIDSIAAERLTRTPMLKSGDARFRWLVFFQVFKLNWVQVAKRAGMADRDYVRDEVHRIADLVSITLRTPKVGAPPKRRNHVVQYANREITSHNLG